MWEIPHVKITYTEDNDSSEEESDEDEEDEDEAENERQKLFREKAGKLLGHEKSKHAINLIRVKGPLYYFIEKE